MNRFLHHGDTIAAVATAIGSGAVAILRLSGPEAIVIAESIFEGAISLSSAEPRRAYLGQIVTPANGNSAGQRQVLDRVLATVFRSPSSFTGEDVVEISCHGGHFLTQEILALLISAGARLAEAGEFSMRAFLNGKMDLTQVEAVADVIGAKTRIGLEAASRQMGGALSRYISSIRQRLVDLCSLLELELDFAEEDVAFAGGEEVARMFDTTLSEVDYLLKTYERGRIIRDGVKLAIIGKPNVGKSSLMNALLREDRAIVTEFAGTTTDVVEAYIDIRGVLFRVADTAGIRRAWGEIERLGVARSLDELKSADIVLAVFDSSRCLDDEDDTVVSEVLESAAHAEALPIVAVLSKCDLSPKTAPEDLVAKMGERPVVLTSAKEGTGVDLLERALLDASVGDRPLCAGEAMITNLRQRNALSKAARCLGAARASLQGGLSGELIAVDLREAIGALGEIIGEVTNEDILDNIFSKFCIGK